jgi:hypothetical protein
MGQYNIMKDRGLEGGIDVVAKKLMSSQIVNSFASNKKYVFELIFHDFVLAKNTYASQCSSF